LTYFKFVLLHIVFYLGIFAEVMILSYANANKTALVLFGICAFASVFVNFITEGRKNDLF